MRLDEVEATALGEQREYLQALSDQLSQASACEVLGWSRLSFHSIRSLYADYDIVVNRSVEACVEDVPLLPKVRSFTLNRATRRKYGVERAVVVSDVHVPYQDNRAIAIVLEVVRDIQPDVIFFNGDFLDFYALSRFDKDPTRALMLQDELDEAHSLLLAFREAAPDARMVFIYGNHENRLRAYLNGQAPALSKLRCLTIEELLEFKSMGIESVFPRGKEAYTDYGNIRIGHFDTCSKHSAATEKALIDKHANSLIQGHTHRLGKFYLTYPGGRVVVGIGSGCTCLTDPEYVSDPNWQQGFVVITRHVEADLFHAVDLAITGYQVAYNDTIYSA